MTTITEVPQNMKALERANQIRYGRAALKRRIKAGKVAVADLLEPGAELPDVVETMGISELLEAQTRWGKTRARALLTPLAIRESRPLEELTEREREALVAALTGGDTEVEDRRLLG